MNSDRRIDAGLKSIKTRCGTMRRWCAKLGSGVELLAVVKANGYGHGMVGVAKALAKEAQFFGVANLEEATTLRREVSHPIIILGPALPAERPPIAEGGFIPSISTFEEAQEFDRVATGIARRDQFRHRYRDGPDGSSAGGSDGAFPESRRAAEHQDSQSFDASSGFERRRGFHPRGTGAVCRAREKASR